MIKTNKNTAPFFLSHGKNFSRQLKYTFLAPQQNFTPTCCLNHTHTHTADLEVKVSDPFGVEILNAVQDLLEKLCGLLLRQRLLLSQEVKQLPTGHQLQDQDHVRFVFKDVVQGNDVAVLDLPKDVDLALDLFAAHPPPAGRQPPLLDELGCVLDACALLLTFTDNCKLSAAGRQRRKEI